MVNNSNGIIIFNENMKPNNKKGGETRLRIDSYDDRRALVAILADNGYKVKVIKRETDVFDDEYFVIIDL